jgi:hypothetical protein
MERRGSTLREFMLLGGVILLLKGVFFLHFLSQVEPGEKKETRLASAFGRLAWYYDGRHYEEISREGYAFSAGNTNHAFFPLLPGVLWVLRALFGDGKTYDGSVVALHASVSVLAGLLLFSVVGRDYSPRTAWWTTVFLFSAPTAIFFDMKYNESWLLLFSAVFLLSVRSGRGVLALIPGLLAGLTRPQGAVVSALSLGLKDGGVRRILLPASAPALGFLAYAAYVAAQSETWSEVASVQESWKRTFNPLDSSTRAPGSMSSTSPLSSSPLPWA